AQLADTLWGDCDGQAVKAHQHGKGRILWNRSVAEVLQDKGIGQDFQYTGPDTRTRLDYVHRRTEAEDIYFVINLNERWEAVDCAFRVAGKQPQLWHPETGQLSDIPAYAIKDGVTRLALHLKPAESVFVVFRKPAASSHFTRIETLKSKPLDTKPIFSPHSATPGGPLWLSDGEGDVADQHITFDLGAVHTLKKISVWNYVEPVRGFMNYGIKDMEVLASTNGTAFRACGTFTLTEAAQVEDKHYQQNLDVQIDAARYVRFDVKTNHNTDWYASGISRYVGLNRVKFFAEDDIAGVKILSVSSGVAFEPASDNTVGTARPDSELRADAANRSYLRVWTPGTYALHRTGAPPKQVEIQSITKPLDITGPWQVSFQPDRGAPDRTTFEPLMSWTDSKDDGIKYFSGCAVYRKEFNVPRRNLKKNAHLELDLGVVQDVARVSLNGQEIAVLWKPPFCVNITDVVTPGKNTLTVEVANNWTNRLIGDAFGPPEKQICRTNLHEKLSREDRRLQPAGLLGPVKIHTAIDVYDN
ncbi:MAG: hypothetical protein GY809_30830, partial [Planctomycetes bacterium]|nr:hypothetical protein [Planctomycetota bacterium]